MNPNRLAPHIILSLILGNTMGLAGSANAATFTSTYYGLTATTLGGGYSLTSDSTGYVTAVTSADGSQTYTFDKYPVIHQFLEIYPGPDGATKNDSVYEVMHNKYGGVDVTYYQYGSVGPDGVTVYSGYPSYPMITSYPVDNNGSKGFVTGIPMDYYGLKSPVNDFNIHGVVVGTNLGGAAVTTNFGYLQNDFPSIPGLVFDSALMVDDSGQVIASGTLNGVPQDFLVTQGQPTPIPAPEPTTLVTLAAASVGVVMRRLTKRQRKESELLAG